MPYSRKSGGEANIFSANLFNVYRLSIFLRYIKRRNLALKLTAFVVVGSRAIAQLLVELGNAYDSDLQIRPPPRAAVSKILRAFVRCARQSGARQFAAEF